MYAGSSLALSTGIASLYGYKTGSSVAKFACENNISIKDAAIEMEILTTEEAQKLLDPMLLIDSEKSGMKISQAAKGEKED